MYRCRESTKLIVTSPTRFLASFYPDIFDPTEFIGQTNDHCRLAVAKRN